MPSFKFAYVIDGRLLVMCRQHDDLDATGVEQRVGADEERIDPLLHEARKGCVDLAIGTGENPDALSIRGKAANRLLQAADDRLLKALLSGAPAFKASCLQQRGAPARCISWMNGKHTGAAGRSLANAVITIKNVGIFDGTLVFHTSLTHRKVTRILQNLDAPAPASQFGLCGPCPGRKDTRDFPAS